MTVFNCTDENPRAQQQYPIDRPMKPLADRILVRRQDDPDNDPSLFMPQCAQKPSRKGVVVACGPGKRGLDGHRRPLCVKAGDVIYFGRYTDYDDGELLLITEQDVVGIVG